MEGHSKNKFPDWLDKHSISGFVAGAAVISTAFFALIMDPADMVRWVLNDQPKDVRLERALDRDTTVEQLRADLVKEQLKATKLEKSVTALRKEKTGWEGNRAVLEKSILGLREKLAKTVDQDMTVEQLRSDLIAEQSRMAKLEKDVTLLLKEKIMWKNNRVTLEKSNSRFQERNAELDKKLALKNTAFSELKDRLRNSTNPSDNVDGIGSFPLSSFNYSLMKGRITLKYGKPMIVRGGDFSISIRTTKSNTCRWVLYILGRRINEHMAIGDMFKFELDGKEKRIFLVDVNGKDNTCTVKFY